MGDLRIIDCEQGTDEWLAARAGIPTASEFATVLAKGEGKMRKTYMLKLAGEILTGEPAERYTNTHMERGHAMEADARRWYAFTRGVQPQQIGFMTDGRKGYSPDSLVGDDGLLEIKTALPHILIEKLLKGTFPAEHKAQCQGGLWVSGRHWIDLVTYWPGLPPFVCRAERDEEYIANLAAEVDRFRWELNDIVGRVRSFEQGDAA